MAVVRFQVLFVGGPFIGLEWTGGALRLGKKGSRCVFCEVDCQDWI